MRKALAVGLMFVLSSGAWAAGGGSGGSTGGGGSTAGGSTSSGGSKSSGGTSSSGTSSSTGGSGGGGNADNFLTTCTAGHVYDKRKSKCVGKSSGLVPNADILAQAWFLAKSGRFADGRELFALVNAQVPANPEALNGLGYTNRKLGNFDIAFGYYGRALAIDPNYLDAREYLGEGYAIAGKLDLAKDQLAEIAKRGGVTVEQYADLSEAIDEAVKSAAAK